MQQCRREGVGEDFSQSLRMVQLASAGLFPPDELDLWLMADRPTNTSLL